MLMDIIIVTQSVLIVEVDVVQEEDSVISLFKRLGSTVKVKPNTSIQLEMQNIA